MREPSRLDVFGDALPAGARSRCGTHRFWHPPDESLGGLYAVGFSPDSRRLVSAQGLTARVWDLEDGRELAVLPGHSGILRAALYVSAERIVTAGEDGTVRLWDAERGTELRRWTLASSVRRLALSPDGRTLLAGTDTPHGFAVLDVERDAPLRQVCPEAALGGTELVAFSRDGTQVFIIEKSPLAPIHSGRLCAFDFESGALQWAVPGAAEWLPWLCLSLDGEQLTCAFAVRGQRAPMTFHARTGAPLASGSFEDEGARCLLPDGTLVKMGDGSVELYGQGAVREFPLPTDCGGARGHPVPSPDGRYVALQGRGGPLLPLELSTGRMGPSRVHRGGVRDVTFSRDGSRLLTYAWDGTARVWDCATGTQVRCEDVYRWCRARYGFIEHSCVADGSMWIATWPDVLVDVLTGIEVAPEGGFRPFRVSGSGDGALIAHVREEEAARLAVVHDARTGRELRRMPLPIKEGEARALSRSGRFLAVWESRHAQARVPSSLSLWDLERQARYAEFFPRDTDVWQFHFTPDDRWLAYVERPCTLVLADLERPGHQRKLESPVPISCIAFTEDSRCVALGSKNGEVRVCTLEGRLLGVLEGHRDDVRAVAFSADGRWLASGSSDTTAVIWPREAWERGGR